jgi:diacylglycerol kinase family enzyme
VSVDGQVVFEDVPGLVFIANVAEYGIGLPILPEADPTDGKLDICILPCSCPEELATHVLRVAAGEHIYGDGVIYTTGRSIRVDSPQAVPVQVDGEAAGTTPLAIDLLSLRLPFIVPKK